MEARRPLVFGRLIRENEVKMRRQFIHALAATAALIAASTAAAVVGGSPDATLGKASEARQSWYY